MNCRSAEALYSSFLEDELTQKERRSFETHLLACRRCSVATRELRATIEMVRELPAAETSPHFEEDVLARVRSGEAMRPSVADWVRGLLEPARLRPLFLAGAGVCAVWIAVIVGWPNVGTPERPGQPVANGTKVAPAPSTAGAPSSPGTELAAVVPTTESNPPPSSSLAAGDASARRAASPRSANPDRAASERASADRQWAGTTGSQDSTLPNPGARYIDEYITDQFFIEHGFEGQTPTVTPVSDQPSDGVDIVF